MFGGLHVFIQNLTYITAKQERNKSTTFPFEVGLD